MIVSNILDDLVSLLSSNKNNPSKFFVNNKRVSILSIAPENALDLIEVKAVFIVSVTKLLDASRYKESIVAGDTKNFSLLIKISTESLLISSELKFLTKPDIISPIRS